MFWDILRELDRQRFECSVHWTKDQWDMFNEIRDEIQMRAMMEDIYLGEE